MSKKRGGIKEPRIRIIKKISFGPHAGIMSIERTLPPAGAHYPKGLLPLFCGKPNKESK